MTDIAINDAVDPRPAIISYGDDRDHESKNRDAGDLTGLDAELAEAGLKSFDTHLDDDNNLVVDQEGETFDGNEDGLREVAEHLAESRPEETKVVQLQDSHGDHADDNIALKSPGQAADALAKMRENDAIMAEQFDADLALEEYGLNDNAPPLTQVQQNEIANEVAQAITQEQTAPQQPLDPVEELSRALQNPAVQQAMVENIEYANQVATQSKNAEMIAAIRSVPEFANCDLSQVMAIDQAIRMQNPMRAQQIDQHLGRIASDVANAHRNAEQQRAQVQAHQTQREQQELYQRQRSVSQAFERNLSDDEVRGVSKYMLDAMGLDVRDPLVQQLLARPEFYEASYKAYRFDRMQNAPTPRRAPKPAPQVTRPGIGRGSAAVANEASMQALHSRLNNSGRIEDAMAILAARRRG